MSPKRDGEASEKPRVLPRPFATTALGPADVRNTPHVKSQFDSEAPPPGEDPWIGRLLSNVYRVERRIGEGGMGAVYLVEHIHLQKSFAVKVLVESISGKNNAVERLRQEAVAASSIDHENIVDVVNFDRTPEGAVFIVMEMLDGEALSETIGRGPIPLERALSIVAQVADALHAAHEAGIVHRDLKPENVFLVPKGEREVAKVLDFGISKVKSADAEQVRMTKTGQLVGTPLYMSPEQARGESEVDRRVDIYAMGVMLYEMLTGAPPFDGRNYFELLWKHGHEAPMPIAERNPNVHVPAALERVLAKALAKEPDERFQTMAELQAALREATPSAEELAAARAEEASRITSPMDEAPVALSRRPWPIAIAALLVGAALLGAGAWALSGQPTDDPGTPIAGAMAAENEAAANETPEPETIEAPPDVEDPPAGVDPPEPARVSLTLTSRPAGATVRLGDETLGTTPLDVPLEAGDTPRVFTFALDGHLDETASVIVREGVSVPEVRLRRRRATQAAGPSPLPIKSGL